MIETKYPTDAFEDAIEATVYMATVHVREGELALPERIRAHLADGPVVVHLVRGERDVAVHEATLTSRSTLTGITWPGDVKPRTSLTVLCPRGGASHDIGVLLPELNVDWPDDDLPPAPQPEPASEPEQDDEPEANVKPSSFAQLAASLRVWNVGDPEPEVGTTVRSVHERSFTRYSLGWQPGPWQWRPLLESEAPLVEVPRLVDLPGPAAYDVPTAPLVLTGELDLPTEDPTWPGTEDSEERTDLLPAVIAPDPTEDVEPGTVFSAALVAVRSQALVARREPPRRAGWLERRVREVARLVLDESYTATRLVVAGVSFLVLAGTGVGFLLSVVAR